MFMNKILQLIDKILDNFTHWGCDLNCVKQPCNCENIYPVTRYVCYKLYSWVLIYGIIEKKLV